MPDPEVRVRNWERKPIKPGGDELQPDTATAIDDQVFHFGAAQAQLLHNPALVIRLAVNHQMFVGLTELSINLFLDDLRPGDAQLKALATHTFY